MDITHTPLAMDLKTHIKGYCVSTTFLPFLRPGCRYETIVVQLDGEQVVDFSDLYLERYGTEDVARTGHIQTVERIKGGWEPQHK